MFAVQVKQLALAVSSSALVVARGPSEETQKILFDDLLSLAQNVWRQTAIEDVLDAIHRFMNSRDGVMAGYSCDGFCIVCYLIPCFLWTTPILAARLRVTKSS